MTIFKLNIEFDSNKFYIYNDGNLFAIIDVVAKSAGLGYYYEIKKIIPVNNEIKDTEFNEALESAISALKCFNEIYILPSD